MRWWNHSLHFQRYSWPQSSRFHFHLHCLGDQISPSWWLNYGPNSRRRAKFRPHSSAFRPGVECFRRLSQSKSGKHKLHTRNTFHLSVYFLTTLTDERVRGTRRAPLHWTSFPYERVRSNLNFAFISCLIFLPLFFFNSLVSESSKVKWVYFLQ